MLNLARMDGMTLRALIWLACLVPLGGGLAGVFGLLPEASSHARYLSGLLLGIGVGLAWAAFDLRQRAWLFDAFVPLIMLGGAARLFGAPSAWPDMLALAMELGVTPLLWWAVRRLAREGGHTS